MFVAFFGGAWLRSVQPGAVSSWSTVGLYFATSLVVGVAFSLAIEKPALAVRERLFPSPRAP